MRPTTLERIHVRSSTFEEAASTICAALGSVDLRREEGAATEFVMRAVRTSAVISTRWSMTGINGGSRGQTGDDSMILTGLVVDGRVSMRTSFGVVDTSRPFIHPGWAELQVDRPAVTNLAITRSAVEAHAAAMTGQDRFPLRFLGASPRDPAFDTVWRNTMTYSARVMNALADQGEMGLAHTALLDLVTATMLRVFPNNALEAESMRDLGGARHAALRRAVRYIDDHLGDPIVVPDIAVAARLSVRGLHAAFRRHYDLTPMQYLRRARLAAARAELRNDPSTPIPLVATRWGFADQRDFVRHYMHEYGDEPPRAPSQ